MASNIAHFLAYNSATDTNVTGDGTAYTVICNSEIFDIGSHYDSATGIFTAPVTSHYSFTGTVTIDQVAVTHSSIIYNLVTTAQTFRVYAAIGTNLVVGTDSLNFNVLAPMSAGDTASMQVIVSGSTLTVDVLGSSSPYLTWFGGIINWP